MSDNALSPDLWSDAPVHNDTAAGPALFRPFRDLRGYDASEASSPAISHFSRLPAEVLVFGFRHSHGPTAGRLRWEGAVLSAMAWLWHRSRGHTESFPYHDGVTIEIGPDEFVVSMWSIASLIWTRFYRKPVPSEGSADDRFAAFYEGIRMAFARLRTTSVSGAPLLQWLGPARTDMPGKSSDRYGQRWSMQGSAVDQDVEGIVQCEVPGVLFYEDVERQYEALLNWDKEKRASTFYHDYPNLVADDYVQKVPDGGVSVDVARVYDVLSAWDLQVHDRLREAGAKIGGYNRRERGVDALSWQRLRARSRGWGPAHLTVGAWQAGQATAHNRRDHACAVPFLVADIDGPTPDLALPVVLALIDRLVGLQVQPADLVVSYTGGRGFHLRIPHGLVSRPLWPRAGDAGRVVARFFERLCDGLATPDGPLVASLDSSLFSPLHLVRAVGSEHDRAPGRRCVAYRGDEFLQLLSALGPGGVLDVVEARSRFPKPVPFSFPDPDRPAAVPALVSMLRASVEDARAPLPKGKSATTSSASREIIAAIHRGVRPGEEFATGHVGRNKAAYLLSINLLTNGGLSEIWAWAALEQWNAKNPVPLGAAEDDDDGELERVFNRACRYVAFNSGSDSGRTSASPS